MSEQNGGDSALGEIGEGSLNGEGCASGGPWSDRRLHFIGIGGAGMSGLAQVAAELGAIVTGSDRARSEYTQMLERYGIEPVIGHSAENVTAGGEVIVSTAISEDNPELEKARKLGIAITHRAELLAELSRMRQTIAVTGTHGKTTTTGMIVHCMQRCGVNPGFVIGGMMPATNTNSSLGEQWFVIEADESDRSFLNLSPEVIVVTNLELDHHTTFASSLELDGAVKQFLALLPKDGVAVLPNNEKLIGLAPEGARLTLFTDQASDDQMRSKEKIDTLYAKSIAFEGMGSSFELVYNRDSIATVKLEVPGRHNALNALAALAALNAAGVDLKEASQALVTYVAASRRFEKKGVFKGADLYDDYAHHPSEVSATLEAARSIASGRLIAVFQPHLYSRTLYLAKEFGEALSQADIVVVTDIYPAREEPVGELSGVSGKMVAESASDAASGRPVYWSPGLGQAEELLTDTVREGDMVVAMGAGDIYKVVEDLASRDK